MISDKNLQPKIHCLVLSREWTSIGDYPERHNLRKGSRKGSESESERDRERERKSVWSLVGNGGMGYGDYSWGF